MTRFFHRATALILTATLALAQTPAPQAPSVEKDDQGLFRLKFTTDLVLVNVVARDKQGRLIRDLKLEDFTLLEDGKPQKLSTFDVESTDQVQSVAAVEAGGPEQLTVLTAQTVQAQKRALEANADRLDNRRLIVLFFDFTSMEPEEIERAVKSASDYINKQMTPADLVAVTALGNGFTVDQDFTADKTKLLAAIQKYSAIEGQGYKDGTTTADGAPDTGAAFTPDDTDYNVFNTDRKLQAIRALAQALANVNQKKSIIYFSGGISQTGMDNQAELRAATNAAVRANVSIYAMDVRGLSALPPGGDASTASVRGVAAYSGAAVGNAFDAFAGSQDTLATLSEDTGGRAFLDSNDFSKVFTRVQDDTAGYYVLGYRSSNPLRDGRFRRIQVKLNRKDLKLEYRAGYYAGKDFQHYNKEDREMQLEEELASDMTATDVPTYMSAAYFRIAGGQYYVPVTLVVPGSAVPFTAKDDKEKATLDVLGVVRTDRGFPLGNARETVKLNLDGAQEVRRKNIQYSTGFTLPPGKYKLKFVIRENQSGRMGSFEADINLPDFKGPGLRMSSVMLGNQLAPAQKKNRLNPLVRDGQELIPNVTHVFSANQQLYLYFEVYDAAKDKSAPKGSPVKLLSSVSFFSGKVKAYETPLVEVKEIAAPDRKAAVFQLSVPLSKLEPGMYTCQVNVVDDAAGAFSFPRLALLVRK